MSSCSESSTLSQIECNIYNKTQDIQLHDGRFLNKENLSRNNALITNGFLMEACTLINARKSILVFLTMRKCDLKLFYLDLVFYLSKHLT